MRPRFFQWKITIKQEMIWQRRWPSGAVLGPKIENDI